MSRHIVLLRGVNLVRRNRIAMPELRRLLEAAGYGDVRTYVQSGNVVLSSRREPANVGAGVRAVIKRSLALDIPVVVRSRDELADIVRRDPLRGIATNPKRYLVTFLERELPPGFAEELAHVSQQAPFAIIGREVYSWHPDGIGRTPLWERLASRSLGVVGTSRNWSTVNALLAMAGETER